MDKLGDMDLFVRVIKIGGLAAAGREIGLSPARMTARINNLEERYGVKLLNRSTRRISATEAGRDFFVDCERVLAEVKRAESRLQTGRETLAGPLNITAPCDIGEQHIGPVLDKFLEKHPDVQPCLHLFDGLVNMTSGEFDVGVRYGELPDSQLIARKLATSHRLLCASPAYLAAHGTPQKPADLKAHRCLTMLRGREPLTTWHFNGHSGSESVLITPSRSSNDGAQIRRWAVAGEGIALKSYLDILSDLKEERLVAVLSDHMQNFQKKAANSNANLNAIYPKTGYLPLRVRYFIDALVEHFSAITPPF